MNSKKEFKKFYAKLVLEAVIKSFIWAFVVGFGVMFAAALITWFSNLQLVWILLISLGSGFIAMGIAAPVFYLKIFSPTDKRIAQRLDRLGLDERIITMLEYEDDDSYIAQRQREDAAAALASVSKKAVKFSFSKVAIALASIVCAAGIGMTTLSSLASADVIPRGKEFVDNVGGAAETVYFDLNYLTAQLKQTMMGQQLVPDENCGLIEGATEQRVENGRDGEQVIAVAEDNFMFAGWFVVYKYVDENGEDKSEQVMVQTDDPVRVEEAVDVNTDVYAVFIEMGEGEGEGEGGEGEGESGEPQEPQEPQDQPGEGQNGESGDGDPSDGQQGGQGDPQNNNNIIDENYEDVDYKAVLEQYMQQVLAKLEAGEELTAEERQMLELYFDIIE